MLGTVVNQGVEFHRVDIGGPQQATLDALKFEGATKRNKPNPKPGKTDLVGNVNISGALIYGQVIMASKNMEPEVMHSLLYCFRHMPCSSV